MVAGEEGQQETLILFLLKSIWMNYLNIYMFLYMENIIFPIISKIIF